MAFPPDLIYPYSSLYALKVTDIPLKIIRCNAKIKKRLNVILSDEKKRTNL